MKRVETSTSSHILRDDGVVVQISRGRQTLEDAQGNMRVFHELAGGLPRLLLCDLRESGPNGPGVREFYASHTKHLLALALIIDGPWSRLIGNFFIMLNRPAAPTRLFTDEASALLWLHAHDVRHK